MGNLPSSALSPEEIEQIKTEYQCTYCTNISIISTFCIWLHISAVTDKELRRIYRRFKKLDTDNSGAISTQEFLSVPELAVNPLLERVVKIFDTNKDDEIQFSGPINSTTFSNPDDYL